ncbi:MAG: 50S ribosomal protein L29 [Chlamydiia bacterium]|nr:50S ribosomal protein L29 [Chlamydiia bacterium]
MNIKDLVELRKLSDEELRQEISQLSASIFIIKSKSSMEKSQARPDFIIKIKKCVARALTIIKEREVKQLCSKV